MTECYYKASRWRRWFISMMNGQIGTWVQRQAALEFEITTVHYRSDLHQKTFWREVDSHFISYDEDRHEILIQTVGQNTLYAKSTFPPRDLQRAIWMIYSLAVSDFRAEKQFVGGLH